jgi:electron transport complex protein RnfG
MNDYIKYPFILFVVTVTCTVLVTFTYNYTTPILMARQAELVEATLNSMYDNIDTYEVDERTYESDAITSVYVTTLTDGSTKYIYEAAAPGKNGNVEMLISVDEAGNYDAIDYTVMNETNGIGTKVTEPEYVDSLTSQSTSSVSVDTISGATYSSVAVDTMMTAVASDYNTNYGGGQ